MHNKIGNKILWFGVVEDRMDPLFLGRCRVRVLGLHTDNKIELPIEDLPWAWPLQAINSAAMSGIGQAPVGPVEGTWLVVTFLDDSYQQPFMMGSIGGIPIEDNARAEDIEDFLQNTIQNQAKGNTSVPENAVTDSSGTPIQTGSGGYVVSPSTASGDNTLGNLSQDQYDKLKQTIGNRESSNNYQAVNSRNYLGKYQMGAGALEDAGYLSPGSTAKYGNQAMNNPSLWTGKDGTTSKDSFLNNPSAQENAMDSNLKTNYKRLNLNDSVPAEKQAGMLTAAHLVGAGGAKQFLNGSNPVDGNGTSAQSYYNLGQKAIAGQATNELPTPQNLASAPIDKNIQNNSNSSSESSKFDPANMPELSKKLRIRGTKDIIGFKDPNEKYPKEDWLEEPDTHRLARHQSIEKTIVVPKEQEREKELLIANSESTWDQTLIPYNADYPFNHVLESESGHTIEIDDTEGMERIHIYHKTGTFVEIDSKGNITSRIKGNEVKINENDNKTHITGTGLITVDGDFSVIIQKSLQVEVVGDVQLYVQGDVRQKIDGDWDCWVKGDMKMRVDGNYDWHIGGDYKLLLDGNYDEHTVGDYMLKIDGAKDEHVLMDSRLTIDGNYDYKAGINIAGSAGDTMSLTAGVMIAGDAQLIHWNSGMSTLAADAGDAGDAKDAVDIEEFEPELKVLDPTTRQSSDDFLMEDASPEEQAKYVEDQRLSNNTPRLAEPSSDIPVDNLPPPPIKPYQGDCAALEDQKPFGSSTRLSTNFTLGQLCKRPGGGSAPLPGIDGQVGLSQDKIVCNLMQLAINVLEPLKQKYPDLIINSGFRMGTGTSQHNKGMAVDLSRRSIEESANKKQLMQEFASEIKNSVPFDQLILESSGSSGSAWVHVSMNADGGNRGSMMTINTSTGTTTQGLGFA